jgi:hypothetical protein
LSVAAEGKVGKFIETKKTLHLQKDRYEAIDERGKTGCRLVMI